MAAPTYITSDFKNRGIWIGALLLQLAVGLLLTGGPFRFVAVLTGVVVFLPVLYMYPSSAYALLFLTLPPYGIILLTLGRLDLRPNDVAIVLGILCLLFQAVRKNRLEVEVRMFHLPVYAIGVWAGATLLWTPNLVMGIFQFFKMTAGILIYFLSVTLLKGKDAFKKALHIWVGISSFWIMASTYSLYFRSMPTAEKIQGRIVEGSLPHLGKTVRVSTFFATPNDLAFIFSIVLVVMILFALSTTTSARIKKLAWAAIILGFIVLIGTFSRKSWLGIAFSLFILGLKYRKIFWGGIAIFIPSIILLLLTSTGGFTEALINRIMSFFLETELTISARAEAWSIGAQLFSASPIVGHGAGSFLILGPMLGSPLNIPHSFYWFMLVEYGLVGILLYLTFLGHMVYRLVRVMKTSKKYETQLFCVGFLGCILSISFQSAFRTIGLSDPFFWSFWGLIALFIRHHDQWDNI